MSIDIEMMNGVLKQATDGALCLAAFMMECYFIKHSEHGISNYF